MFDDEPIERKSGDSLGKMYMAGVMVHTFSFFLCNKEEGNEIKQVALRGNVEKATRFVSREDALKSVQDYLKDRPLGAKVGTIFIMEVEYFTP